MEYRCAYPGCSHISGRPFDVQCHRKSHHPLTTKDKFDCPVKFCSWVGEYAFDRKEYLTEHLRASHGGLLKDAIRAYPAGRREREDLKLLLEAGAPLEIEDNKHGQELLSNAAKNGHEAVVKVLLKRGVKPDIKEKIGYAPLSYAARDGYDAEVKLRLEEGAEPETKDTSRLSYAAQNGHVTAVKLLLDKGASPDLKDKYSGRTPLSNAALRGQDTVVKLLLEEGAKPDLKDGYGRAPLSYAAQNGHVTAVKLLLDKGASPDLKDKYSGRTPLSNAALRGQDTVVKLLLEEGAKPDIKDENGHTPLSYAAQDRHDAVVKLLIEKGAKPDIKENPGRTPLYWATKTGYDAVVKLLLDTGARVRTGTFGSMPKSFLKPYQSSKVENAELYGQGSQALSHKKGSQSMPKDSLTEAAGTVSNVSRPTRTPALDLPGIQRSLGGLELDSSQDFCAKASRLLVNARFERFGKACKPLTDGDVTSFPAWKNVKRAWQSNSYIQAILISWEPMGVYGCNFEGELVYTHPFSTIYRLVARHNPIQALMEYRRKMDQHHVANPLRLKPFRQVKKARDGNAGAFKVMKRDSRLQSQTIVMQDPLSSPESHMDLTADHPFLGSWFFVVKLANLRLHAENWLKKWKAQLYLSWEPPLEEGKQRIRWRCVCQISPWKTSKLTRPQPAVWTSPV